MFDHFEVRPAAPIGQLGRLLDVTLRDGGFEVDFEWPPGLFAEVPAVAAPLGVDVVELGYIGGVPLEHAVRRPGVGAFITPQHVETARGAAGAGVELAAMVHPTALSGDLELSGHAAAGLDMVRLVYHPRWFDGIARLATQARDLGVLVSVNLALASRYAPGELAEQAAQIDAVMHPNVVYLADTCGALVPDQVGDMVQEVAAVTSCPIGFHAHDFLSIAYANALAAAAAGATLFDVSLLGLGRGGGNLVAELVLLRHRRGPAWTPARIDALLKCRAQLGERAGRVVSPLLATVCGVLNLTPVEEQALVEFATEHHICADVAALWLASGAVPEDSVEPTTLATAWQERAVGGDEPRNRIARNSDTPMIPTPEGTDARATRTAAPGRAPGQISHRSSAIVAYSYRDFPVADEQVDLRGDTLPALSATAAALQTLTTAPPDIASYGDVAGHLQLRQTLAELFGVDASAVVVTVGGSEALHLALTCVADGQEQLLLPRPAFPGFDQLAHLLGLRRSHYDVPGPVPTDRVSPMLVCTPHNPTGAVTRPGDLGTRPGWTIWDVSHSSLAADQLQDIKNVLASSPNAVAVFSLSKLLRLPGARVGALISRNAAFVTAATALKTHLSMSVDHLAQTVATRILTSPDTLPELRSRQLLVTRHRAEVIAAASRSQTLIPVPATDGTHIWIRMQGSGDAWEHLRDGGVVGLPGPVFNGPADAVRLCIAQPAERIRAAVTLLEAL